MVDITKLMYMYIYTHFPAYQTAQKADRWSGRNTSTHTLPCLPEDTKGRSPVREKHKHTHTSQPTRPHKRQIAAQGETQAHTHTSLPTRPHKRQIAGQGETQAHTHFPAYQTAQKADRRSGRNTSTHTHSPAYQTAQKADRRSGRNTSTHTLSCLPDRTKGRSPVRKKPTYVLLLQACTYMYLRARCTVEVQFPFCRSSGSGRVQTTLIIFTLGDRRNRRRNIWKCYWPGLAIKFLQLCEQNYYEN